MLLVLLLHVVLVMDAVLGGGEVGKLVPELLRWLQLVEVVSRPLEGVGGRGGGRVGGARVTLRCGGVRAWRRRSVEVRMRGARPCAAQLTRSRQTARFEGGLNATPSLDCGGLHVGEGADLLGEGEGLVGRDGRLAGLGQAGQHVAVGARVSLEADEDDGDVGCGGLELGRPEIEGGEEGGRVGDLVAEEEDLGGVEGQGPGRIRVG